MSNPTRYNHLEKYQQLMNSHLFLRNAINFRAVECSVWYRVLKSYGLYMSYFSLKPLFDKEPCNFVLPEAGL